MKHMTVKNILNQSQFKDFKVIAGKKGLNRVVNSITVLDAPDPFKWSKGGEIVLTSGYIFTINNFKEIIEGLYKINSAAVFIKVSRFLKVIPEEIIEYCDEVGFPLVDVPMNLAFIDVINPTLAKLISTQKEIIQISDEVQTLFTELVINNADTDTIVNEISKILNEDIAYYDINFERIHFAKNSKFNSVTKSMLLGEMLEKYQNYPIGLENEPYGFIIFNKDISEKIKDEYNILSHANTALILDAQKKINSSQIEDRHKNEFVQDLFLNNIKSIEEVNKRANLFSWEFKKSMKILTVDIDDFKKRYFEIDKESKAKLDDIRDAILKNSKKIIKSYFLNAYYASFSDSISFIIQFDKDEDYIDELIDKACEEISKSTKSKFDFTVTIGIGDTVSSSKDVNISFKQASSCIKIGRVLYKSNTKLAYKKLGVYKLLYSIYDNEDVKNFAFETLGKLQSYDEENSTEFMKTLNVLSDNDWNLKKASEEMFIHYNTMKYRTKKISDIINLDLGTSENRLNILIALKIYNMI